jgi:chromate reductase
MKVLALCGSIRKNSSNHALLMAVKNIFPELTSWLDFAIEQLPFFDPILQFADTPALIGDLRRHALHADVLVISTPEYAHGIPGVLKNALEWLVCEETMKKPVILFIASSDGSFVKEYLLETLRTMDMLASAEATMLVKNAKTAIDPSGKFLDTELQTAVQAFLTRLSVNR